MKMFAFLSLTIVFLFFTTGSSNGQPVDIRQPGTSIAHSGDLNSYTVTPSNNRIALEDHFVIVDYLPLIVYFPDDPLFPSGEYNRGASPPG